VLADLKSSKFHAQNMPPIPNLDILIEYDRKIDKNLSISDTTPTLFFSVYCHKKGGAVSCFLQDMLKVGN
jgi:hypothetical protein